MDGYILRLDEPLSCTLHRLDRRLDQAALKRVSLGDKLSTVAKGQKTYEFEIR